MSNIAPIDLNILFQDFGQLERLGSPYNYGGKAMHNGRMAKGSELALVTPQMIVKSGGVDCSGAARYLAARATKGKLIMPDGSQNQLAWAQQVGLHKVIYRDAAFYINKNRLFIAFIKPYTNGCGSVGHVFYLAQYNDGNNGTLCGSIESCGAGGCVSRPWNYPTLLREQYACFELPTLNNVK